MNKSKSVVLAGLGLVVAATAAYWLLVEQPARRTAAVRAEHALLDSGIQLYKDKRFAEAAQTLSRIPDTSAYAAEARYHRGNAYIMLKDYAAAAQQLEQALALDQHNANVSFALGVTYFKLGELALARAYFASVLEMPAETDEDRALREEAKGLMDIMARLERQQAQAPSQETAAEPAHGGVDD